MSKNNNKDDAEKLKEKLQEQLHDRTVDLLDEYFGVMEPPLAAHIVARALAEKTIESASGHSVSLVPIIDGVSDSVKEFTSIQFENITGDE
tara:strand:+ start:8884 stop:9156 length:273 start_codon:yes stop_codon:yes gene_type:complete